MICMLYRSEDYQIEIGGLENKKKLRNGAFYYYFINLKLADQ